MIAKMLNDSCLCRTFEPERLRSNLESSELLQGLSPLLFEDRQGLFSATTVFVSSHHLEEIKTTIGAIEEVIQNTQYRKMIFDRSPAIADYDKGPQGVFMGYDFHLTDEGPMLIEINTNAGGALLNLELARAQRKCCPELLPFYGMTKESSDIEQLFVQMFMNEWEKQRGSRKIGLIAIVDDNPEGQYLYPEFRMFQNLFLKNGIKSVIADPIDLYYKDKKLCFKGEIIDFLYNRLTDFYLEEESHASIRVAYEQDAVVLSPSPHHHALYANKLNLAVLSNGDLLDELSVPQKTKEILLNGIPRTEEVSLENASALWEKRRELFFKPIIGFGSKAAYRGDKITRKVWTNILSGRYVAQTLIPPSRRSIAKVGSQTDLKLDIRAYVYQGKIQLLASRLYSGQTTNFRTEGGGFAPIIVVSDQEIKCLKNETFGKYKLP